MTQTSELTVIEVEGGFAVQSTWNGYTYNVVFDTAIEAEREKKSMLREFAAERRWERRVS